ncbi:MAG: response regulator [Bacteroidota bacterium]
MRKVKTMIVDDSPVQYMIIKQLVLCNPCLQLYECTDAETDINVTIVREKIELLILDVEMPKMNGFEFINALKRPALIIMNSTKSYFEIKAREYGADFFLKKPVNKKTFNRSIADVLIKHALIETENEYRCIRYDELI